MIRSDFLKTTLLAPLAAFFGLKAKPEPEVGPVEFYRDTLEGAGVSYDRKALERIVGEYGGRWSHDFARDVYICPSGREYALEYLESVPGAMKLIETRPI